MPKQILMKAVLSSGSLSWCRPLKRKERSCCCLAIENPPERPDPASYSQEEQFALGSIATWNSPDITTNNWSPFRLRLEAEVKVRNLSAIASAVNVLVHLFTSQFGIGIQRSLLSTKMINLAALQELTLLFPFSQSILNGPQTIGVYTKIEHSSDSSLINNNGAQVHHGVMTSESGRGFQFAFPVLNNQGTARQISLSVLPNDLGASVSPGVRNCAAWEQYMAHVILTVPSTTHGTPDAYVQKEVTIVGRYEDGSLIGGLTYVVRIDD